MNYLSSVLVEICLFKENESGQDIGREAAL